MFLGIEIGGTKLQLAVGEGNGQPFADLVRLRIDRAAHAEGIRRQIADSARGLLNRFPIKRVGVGFGGPVHSATGRTITSHQVEGWDGFPLADWCREQLGVPAAIVNDCDAAALAEARFGAGRGAQIVLFITVGTGIGGGLVVDGRLHATHRPAAVEIGHLRPGLDATDPHRTVESLAAGPGIEASARAWVALHSGHVEAEDLLRRCSGDPEGLTAQLVGEAAAEGNYVARGLLRNACRALGWAVAQAVTLLSPEVVVVGGGVSQLGEELFLMPIRDAFRTFVFPPLRDACRIVPAALGDAVVVHGALAIAGMREQEIGNEAGNR